MIVEHTWDNNMTLEDIENYIKVIEVNPKSKYLLVVSKAAGIPASDLYGLKLNEQFIDTVMLVSGRPKDMIESFPLTKN